MLFWGHKVKGQGSRSLGHLDTDCTHNWRVDTILKHARNVAAAEYHVWEPSSIERPDVKSWAQAHMYVSK